MLAHRFSRDRIASLAEGTSLLDRFVVPQAARRKDCFGSDFRSRVSWGIVLALPYAVLQIAGGRSSIAGGTASNALAPW